MTKNPFRVLLIEDNPGDAFLIERSLTTDGSGDLIFQVCHSLASGLEALAASRADVVLLDLGLPDSVGFETFEAVRDSAGAVPILILTGLDDEDMGARAVRSGAQDYLIKGQINGDLLRRSIKYAVERKKSEEENKRLLQDLDKKVKEQKVLYRVAKILQDSTLSQDTVLSEIVGALPAAWQFPDITQARITAGDKEYKTPAFRATPWMQAVEFSSDNGTRWKVEVSLSRQPAGEEIPFLDEERALLDSISEMIRGGCERRHAIESLEWESGVNARMSELSRALISRMPIEEISLMVLDVAKRFTGSEYGFVGYIDRQTGNLVSTTLTVDIWDKCRVKDKRFVFEHPRGLFGWVLENRKPILTNSPASDPRSGGTPEGHLPINRFLSVPALIGDELIGQIALANSNHDYTEKDLMLAERLAVAYALAVKRQQEIESLVQSEFVIEHSPAILFRCRYEEGLPVEYISRNVSKFGYGAEEIVSRKGCTFIHQDDAARVLSELAANAAKGRDAFELEFRMNARGSVVWADVRVTLIRDGAGAVTYLQGIINDITMRKEVEFRLKEETELNAQLLSIAKAAADTADLSRLMEQVTVCIMNVLRAEAVLSYTWDGKSYRPEHAAGLKESMTHLFRSEHLKKEALFLLDAANGAKPYVVAPEKVRTLSSVWIENGSVLIIPLSGKEGSLGLLVAIMENKGLFEPDERMKKLLEGISSQVSTALEEARLYKTAFDRMIELSRKMETIQTMHEIDRSILSTLDRTEILETSAMLIAKIIPCDKTMILLLDKDGGGLRYGAGFGTACVKKGDLIKSHETDAYEVVKTGRPQYAHKLSDIKDILPFEAGLMRDGFLSHIRVPLSVKGETIGVLSCGSRRPSAFTYDDLSTLEKLSSQVAVALENSRLLTDIEELFLGTLKALSEAIDAKSPWTHGHSERVTRVSIEVGKEVGLSEAELKELEIAGLLHDIGKLGTYESILDKPGRLTEDENSVIRMHPAKGADILSSIKQLRKIIPAIRHHHEFYDGTGYPAGLSGGDIPFMARILSVADTIDAMCADRPYRKGKDVAEVIAELKRCSGTQFDPAMVEASMRIYRSGKLSEALKLA